MSRRIVIAIFAIASFTGCQPRHHLYQPRWRAHSATTIERGSPPSRDLVCVNGLCHNTRWWEVLDAYLVSSTPFLACTRAHESDTAGGYQAVSPGGMYRGAYQFARTTWNNTALRAGRPDLVGVDPAAASPADQDLLALTLYREYGTQPWGGRCAGLS